MKPLHKTTQHAADISSTAHICVLWQYVADCSTHHVIHNRWAHSPSQLAWSEGWRPPGAQSAFIKWTGWTLAVTMVMMTAP